MVLSRASSSATRIPQIHISKINEVGSVYLSVPGSCHLRNELRILGWVSPPNPCVCFHLPGQGVLTQFAPSLQEAFPGAVSFISFVCVSASACGLTSLMLTQGALSCTRLEDDRASTTVAHTSMLWRTTEPPRQLQFCSVLAMCL